MSRLAVVCGGSASSNQKLLPVRRYILPQLIVILRSILEVAGM